MAKDNNIKNYTGADIEKYNKGLLSAKERHDLEKAALDDPFLADALEGYAVAAVDHSADMNDLKKRLAEKVEAGKVIVMKGGSKTSFPWLRVAALVVILAGAALMARQFIFTGKSKEIAQAEPKKAEEIKPHDSVNTVTTTSELKLEKTNNGTVAVPVKQKDQFLTFYSNDSTADRIVSKERVGEKAVTTNELTVNNAERDKQPAAAPVKTDEDKKIRDNMASGAAKKEIAREEIKNKPDTGNKQFFAKDGDGIKDRLDKPVYDQKRAVAANRKAAEDQNYRYQATNTFRGRVTDANNVGLPFARVYNPTDNNAGTYTDVAGNFNLTYPDSVLTVQVKSVGFENTNVQLRNSVANNQVVLQDDRSLAAQTLTAPRKINAEERGKTENKFAKVKLIEPEPADGWDNYDTYLTNNLNVPEEIKTKQNGSGQVQVSFEVDKNGEPINIKIEKSLCPKCDEEAKRLIKEGPKWKRNAKKGRTTVTIPFDISL
jgi:TonB family protein